MSPDEVKNLKKYFSDNKKNFVGKKSDQCMLITIDGKRYEVCVDGSRIKARPVGSSDYTNIMNL